VPFAAATVDCDATEVAITGPGDGVRVDIGVRDGRARLSTPADELLRAAPRSAIACRIAASAIGAAADVGRADDERLSELRVHVRRDSRLGVRCREQGDATAAANRDGRQTRRSGRVRTRTVRERSARAGTSLVHCISLNSPPWIFLSTSRATGRKRQTTRNDGLEAMISWRLRLSSGRGQKPAIWRQPSRCHPMTGLESHPKGDSLPGPIACQRGPDVVRMSPRASPIDVFCASRRSAQNAGPAIDLSGQRSVGQESAPVSLSRDVADSSVRIASSSMRLARFSESPISNRFCRTISRESSPSMAPMCSTAALREDAVELARRDQAIEFGSLRRLMRCTSDSRGLSLSVREVGMAAGDVS